MIFSFIFKFLFVVSVSIALCSSTEASITLSQVENLIQEKLRDVISENSALKTDVLILKQSNLAMNSKFKSIKKSFEETIKNRLKKITRKHNRQFDDLKNSIVNLQQVQEQIKNDYSMNFLKNTEKYAFNEGDKKAEQSFSEIEDKIQSLDSNLDKHIKKYEIKTTLTDEVTKDLYEGIKLIKEDIVELESSKTSTQNTITKLEEELIKLEDFATVIDYNLTDYMNNNSFLLINLETKIEEIENSSQKIKRTDKGTVAKVIKQVTKIQNKLEEIVSDTTVLQKSIRPLSCQDVLDANSLAETKFYNIYKSLIDPTGEKIKCNMNGRNASQVQILHNCMEVKAFDGSLPDDIYEVTDANQTSIIKVFCESDWTYFHRRFNGSLNFRRFFNDYKNGFGDKKGEHWLGLEPLHQLTKSGHFLLRVDMKDFYGNDFYAEYKNFHIGEGPGYRLHLGKHSGNIKDLLSSDHEGANFSTLDRDQDSNLSYDCASDYNGAFWLKSCGKINPNSYTYGNDMSNSHMHWGQKNRKNYNMQAMSFKFKPFTEELQNA